MSSTKLIHGDCLLELKKLPDKSVDLFILDLPYGETNCKWDKEIDLKEFWVQFKRVRKSKRTACIHFCSMKFGYKLIQSNEKMFKMDMVWKKRNKTGGLCSRYRPMRNHEHVFFFYEQAPKYNRDKYHKRINNVKHADSDTTGEKKAENTIIKREKKNFKPIQPASIVEEKTERKSIKDRKGMITKTDLYPKENQTSSSFEPTNPCSIVEEKYTKEHLDNNRAGAGTNTKSDIYTKEAIKKFQKENGSFEPPNPCSIVEEKTVYGIDPDKTHPKGNGLAFEPPNPASVVEALIEPAEDEPKSMFESAKVFIGKRNHQTEKPLDILEFFIKYWSDEEDIICDPTMGSGSTGVACKKLNRNFIGIELDDEIFKVAKNRINNS